MTKKTSTLFSILFFLSISLIAQTPAPNTNPLLKIKKYKLLHKEFPEFEWETIDGEKSYSKDFRRITV